VLQVGLILESIPTKDIAVAVLGGSAAIASILLVFVGFIIMKAEGLPSTTSDRVIRRYTLAAKWGFLPVFEQTLVLSASYLWLFHPDSTLLFRVWSVGFPVGVVLFIGYSAYITLRL
jgi:hypothetical protein